MQKIRKRNKGITLIALVVTIIVLLILAGISISMLTGENGILGRAGEARDRTHEAGAKEELDMWLMEYHGDRYLDEATGLKEFLESKGAKVTETDDGKLQVETGGETFIVDPDTLQSKLAEKGIPELDVQVGEQEGNKVKITVTVTNADDIDSIDEVVLKDASGKEIKSEKNVTGKEVTFEVDKNGNYTVEVKATTEKKQYTTSAKATVNKFTADINQVLGYGTIDVIWVDKDNKVQPNPNSPNLYDGQLTKVTWTKKSGVDESVGTAELWTEDNTASSDWYDYKAKTGSKDDNTESRWANAKNDDGSYFVWIPRYAYRITYYASEDAYKSGSAEPIAYYDGNGLVDTNGNVAKSLKAQPIAQDMTGIQTVESDGKSYIVHPAFYGIGSEDLGGGFGSDSKGIEGIWVAKYEMSKENTDKAVSKPSTKDKKVQSWRNIIIAKSYKKSYEYNRDEESHLMKNSEWGAVAYLTHSQYGRNGKEITINNSKLYYTGMAGDTVSAGSSDTNENYYNTVNGVKASTTGNVYGIYDLSGGAYEGVAAYNVNYEDTGNGCYRGSSYLDEDSKNFAYEAQQSEEKSTKYVTAYNGGNTSSGTTIEHQVGKVGDATKEVLTGTNGSSSHWFGDYSNILHSSGPFFLRGGAYSLASLAGVFSAGSGSGSADPYYSFRVVLAG